MDGQSAQALLLLFVLLFSLQSPTSQGAPSASLMQSKPIPDRQAIKSSTSLPDSCSLSANGKVLAFTSPDPHLTPVDFNGWADVFVWDQETKQISLVSVSSQGAQGNAISNHPSLSGDGRFVAFSSLADNLVDNDTNHTGDVFLHDRLTHQTELVSSGMDGAPGSGWSGWPDLSADGRYVAFWSRASNLAPDDRVGTADIFVRDRLTRQTRRIVFPEGLSQVERIPHRPFISGDGRYVAFTAQRSGPPLRRDMEPIGKQSGFANLFLYDQLTGLTAQLHVPANMRAVIHHLSISANGGKLAFVAWLEGSFAIVVYDQRNDTFSTVPSVRAKKAPELAFALSADGRWLAYLSAQAAGHSQVFLYDVQSGSVAPLTQDGREFMASTIPDLSANGRFIAFAHPDLELAPGGTPGNLGDFLIVDRGENLKPRAFLSGWVSDGLGHPIAGVLIADEFGRKVTSGADGSFHLEDLFPGGYTITPSKTGYTFIPPSLRVFASPQALTSIGLAFTTVPAGVVETGRADIGMPYSANRGCPSPLQGCGGPFNGFFRGGCTDIVLDAYRIGADFNIQIALEMDFKKHPNHYYQLLNARRAWEMWRYFVYTHQMLPHEQPYLIGDIVFFDWDDDGIMDHVSLISQVDDQGRPLAMIDATGEINDNPNGLASELGWQSYHEAHVTGHARWTGTVRLNEPQPDPDLPILLVALDSPTANLRLLDSQGNAISPSGTKLPGGAYRDMGAGAVISLNSDFKEGDWYMIEIYNPIPAPYQLGIQIVQRGVVTAAGSYIRSAAAGELTQIYIQITNQNGQLRFVVPQLEP